MIFKVLRGPSVVHMRPWKGVTDRDVFLCGDLPSLPSSYLSRDAASSFLAEWGLVCPGKRKCGYVQVQQSYRIANSSEECYDSMMLRENYKEHSSTMHL